MTPRRNALCALALAAFVAGCGEELDSISLAGDGSTLASGDGGGPATDPEGDDCAAGDVEDCRIALGTHNGVSSCIQGERRCRGEVWGPCEGSIIARPVGDAPGDDGSSSDETLTDDRRFDDAFHRVALTDTTECADVCDPKCEAFADVVPGSATPPSTEVPPPIVGGSRLSFEQMVPGSFQARLLKEPCAGLSGACQTDTFCSSNQCVPFDEDQYRTVGGPDYTVGLPCGDGVEAKIPICNRGNMPSQAGVKLAFLSSNSNQLQSDMAKCVLASNRTFHHVCTIDEVIQPGQCVMAPPSCDAGLQGNNKALLINPTRSAPNALAGVVEASGACANNWSWWDTAVTCDVCTPAVEIETVVRSGGACAATVHSTIPTSLLTERTVIGTSRPKSTTAWSTLTRVAEADGCSGGLEYWIDESQVSLTAHLCPALCDSLAGASAPQLRMAVQCPVSFEPSLTASVTFEGVCPLGTRTQWGYLSYNALVPGDARLDLDIRTDEAEPLLTSWQSLASITTLDDLLEFPVLDTAACLATDPDPECPISLWTELDGAPDAAKPFLEVRYSLYRSTNERLAPQLHSIETTFSCPDSE